MTATAVGEALGRFRLVEEIGRGGMGTVYKAVDTEMKREVAVKVLAPELAAQPGFEARFRREAQAAARLSEPHILPVFEAGELDGRLFLAMPLVEGADVQRILHRDGPMAPERTVQVISDVASALDAAHAARLVHRDVKPSNILVAKTNGLVFLIDFGIAQDASATKLTSTGTTVGTWAYMAPERFMTATADARADIYSLACVLYECLTGKLPYPGDSMPQQVHGHCYLPPPKPTEINRAISAGFDQVIARGMAKDPKHRYKSCRELAVAARLALSGPAPTMPPTVSAKEERRQTSRPPSGPKAPSRPPLVEPPRPWSNARVSAMVIAVVVVALTGAFLLVHHPSLPGVRETQVTLPFEDLDSPDGIAVDSEGAVYVADSRHNRVLKLAAGSKDQIELPFTGLSYPEKVALDSRGNIYVTGFNRQTHESAVMELTSGATASTELPIHLEGSAAGIAVDGVGTVYVTEDNSDGGLYKFAPGATAPNKLLAGSFDSVAIDSVGNIYVASEVGDPNVIVLPVGEKEPRATDFPSVSLATGVAVDSAGSMYVSDGWGSTYPVYKLVAGSTKPTTVPFAGLTFPDSLTRGIAVDGAGNVYVTDEKLNRVIELHAR
jgi:serine/threonine-protein kinase